DEQATAGVRREDQASIASGGQRVAVARWDGKPPLGIERQMGNAAKQRAGARTVAGAGAAIARSIGTTADHRRCLPTGLSECPLTSSRCPPSWTSAKRRRSPL